MTRLFPAGLLTRLQATSGRKSQLKISFPLCRTPGLLRWPAIKTGSIAAGQRPFRTAALTADSHRDIALFGLIL